MYGWRCINHRLKDPGRAMYEFSVIIPTWNRAKLLEKAVRSVLSQTLPPLEVLVCDDGSTDESEAVINSIGDARVRWLTGERAGRPAIPRNRGLHESRGEWIAFLDNDDEWLPDKMEKQLQKTEQQGCRASCANAKRFLPGKGFAGSCLNRAKGRISFDVLLKINQVICSSAVLHRSLLEVVEGFPEAPELKAVEDYALWLRIGANTDFFFLDEELLYYRDEPSASIRSGGVDEFEQRRRVFGDFLDWGRRKGLSADLTRKVRQQLFRDKIKIATTQLVSPARKIKKVFLP